MQTLYDYKTVATIVSNRLFDDIEKIYAMLGHMTGQLIASAQYDKAAHVCASYFHEKFPPLRTLDFTQCNEYNYGELLNRAREILGDTIEIPPQCVAVSFSPALGANIT